MLQEGGADVANARGEYGAPPLHWLAIYGPIIAPEEERAALRLLLAGGARTSGVFDDTGRSPLMVAAETNNMRLARFLIEEAHAPVSERASATGQTALLCACRLGRSDDAEMLIMLLGAGADADVEVRDRNWDRFTPLRSCVYYERTASMRVLLDLGASVNVITADERTPLIEACGNGIWLCDDRWPLFQKLLRLSTAETRRLLRHGDSAVDLLAQWLRPSHYSSVLPVGEALRVKERCRWAIAELLASGARLRRPENVSVVLPIAASVIARHEADLAARRAETCSWSAHEAFVGLSLDFGELRDSERAAAQRRARSAALERELEEMGAGTAGSSSNGDEAGGRTKERGENDAAVGQAGAGTESKRVSERGRAGARGDESPATMSRGVGGGGGGK